MLNKMQAGGIAGFMLIIFVLWLATLGSFEFDSIDVTIALIAGLVFAILFVMGSADWRREK